MASGSILQATPDKKAKKKKIVIMEPSEHVVSEKTKVYRKSVFPGIRESLDMSLNSRRQSSTGNLLSSLMSSGFPSLQSRRWTSRRSTMYKAPRFQNNYRMESRNPFVRERVQLIVDRYLTAFVEQHKYNPRRAKRLAENLSVDLRDVVKRCGFERYRILAVVTVGDKNSQDFKSVMRFVWDADKDGYVNVAYETSTYFIIATVFAVYYE
ncbi:dynein light chain Tctex-type 5-B [Aedes albopictus]|uniref:Dynein light chain n=1 Tax=Aedes albopictus TaxID=7160 RepID=A0ABM1XM02_AEDAL|nr:tctex1 domain-containing protein 1-B-like isoform X2 [Aedes albopictus]